MTSVTFKGGNLWGAQGGLNTTHTHLTFDVGRRARLWGLGWVWVYGVGWARIVGLVEDEGDDLQFFWMKVWLERRRREKGEERDDF